MRVGFIGDVVGRPGRAMIKENIKKIKDKYQIDAIIANTENASHGFGLTIKNANELFNSDIDIMTGGNHTWDKKEIIGALESMNILRPYNYPKGVPGKGIGYISVNGYKLAVINLMGFYTMPMCDNPFLSIQKALEELEECDGIFIDFHAEATSEKRALLALLKGKVSAIVGTHTHVSTDDLLIDEGTMYITDIGMTGCRDNVIGMDKQAPLKRFLTGLPASLSVPNKCKKILQMVVFDLDSLTCKDAFKIKLYEGYEEVITKAWHEQ